LTALDAGREPHLNKPASGLVERREKGRIDARSFHGSVASVGAGNHLDWRVEVNAMAIVLHHHPFSRAAGVIWMLEEVGAPYELRFVDIMKGEQKSPDVVALNRMGKLPVLVDGDAVVTEAAAIGLYLADRYAYGRLSPKVDDPARGTYLRWSLFAPSVVEPGSMAKQAGWTFKESQAGWGSYEAMLASMENAVTGREFLLGNTFSMADVIFGGTLRFMLMVKLLEARPAFTAYAERLSARPALKRADEVNAKICAEHGLKT
jgi:glutathione S-transferase